MQRDRAEPSRHVDGLQRGHGDAGGCALDENEPYCRIGRSAGGDDDRVGDMRIEYERQVTIEVKRVAVRRQNRQSSFRVTDSDARRDRDDRVAARERGKPAFLLPARSRVAHGDSPEHGARDERSWDERLSRLLEDDRHVEKAAGLSAVVLGH